jgi:NAD(P)H-hydrate epimerase
MAVELRHSAILVDAVFGTGLKREVGGHFAVAIELMQRSGLPLVAVDIPSGLNSDSGQVMGCCAGADLTVTYGLAKPGQVIYPGAELTGSLRVVDIGIPPEAVAGADITTVLLQKNDVAAMVPGRPAASHKGVFGHLLVLAGSQGKTGAAILCGQAALRTGTGLVSLGSPRRLNNIYETRLPEAMTVPLASDYYLDISDYTAIAAALRGKKAVVLGPGLGLADETRELVGKLYNEVDLPMVLDADGLNCLAGAGALAAKGAVRIMTPHPGEMARLTGLSTGEIQADRLAVAAAFARKNNMILVLKGAATIIADPNGRLAINPTGNPGMAVGGMGDVLAGIIGGLLAQGLSAWEASCLGVYLHGLAADRIAENVRVGFLASEVADEIPLALLHIAKENIC